MTARIITFFNQKGGVGKTTTTYLQADAANAAGLKTLLIDTDPQGNLTKSVTHGELASDAAGLADVLTSRVDTEAHEVIVKTIWENVELIPTPSRALDLVRDELLVTSTGRENRLKKAIKPLLDQYDLVLIDCPPSIDMLTVNALVASHGLVIITQPALWSIDGIAELLFTVRAVQEDYNEDLAIDGIIVNQYIKNTNSGRRWLIELEAAAESHNMQVLHPPMPQAVRLKEITESSRSLQGTPDDELARTQRLYLNKLTKEQ